MSLKNELDALPVYDDRYIKIKIRKYDNKVQTNFQGLHVPEDGVEIETFAITSVNSLLAYDWKYYLRAYLDNCTYTIVSKKIIDNSFQTIE